MLMTKEGGDTVLLNRIFILTIIFKYISYLVIVFQTAINTFVH